MNLTPILQSPDEKRERIRSKVIEGLTESFPITSRNKTIEVTDVAFTPRNYTSNEQKMAILRGDSLFETAKGTVKIKDAKSGKVLDEVNNFTLARVPWFTPRHTLIVSGNEYSIANMVRPKPGVYARKRANGILEASFNTVGTSNFNITMDPEKGEPELEYGSSKIPLYTILRASGISHDNIAKKWGAALASENRNRLEKNLPRHVDKLYRKVVPAYALLPDLTVDAKMEEVVKRYGASKMDAKVNAKTLGHAYGNVTPDSLLDASAKVLNIFRNPGEVDDRDNLDFKSLKSVEDFFKERIQLDARDIGRRAAIKIDATPEVRRAMTSGAFTPGLVKFITGSELATIPTQTNPMELIDSAVRVTSLGEGGISSERAIPMEARMIHPTQIGAIDPVRTAESFKAGIDVRAALAAHHDKDGNIYVPMIDNATGKHKYIRAGEIANSTVAFPQQVMKGKVSALVNGRIASVQANKAQYQIPHSSVMYGPTSNLIPFMESLQGNRQLMGSKHQTQAISLVDREAPYVQVMSPSGQSFEHVMATIVNPTAPIAGTVEKVDGDYIYIRPHTKTAAAKKDKDSDLVRVSYDTYLPMASKTYLNHDVSVKTGDVVKSGDILAESNFTKDKTLALGKNLSVAYMPYYGANSNDAVVISAGAAKKLTSERLYKIVLPRDADMVFNNTKHKTYYGHTYGHDYYSGVDEEGVVKPGAKINSGEPVVFGLRKSTLTSDDILLGRLHKSLVKPFRDATQTWDHDHPGEVVDVVKTPKRIAITIKTQEPMQIGDKLCYTEDTEVLTSTGWKSVADITTDDLCYTLDPMGNIQRHYPTHLHSYPEAGQLFLIRSQHADLSVTLDHCQVIKTGEGNALVPSRELVDKTFQLIRTGNWTNKSVTATDAWCALTGLYAVKGHLVPITLTKGEIHHAVEIHLRDRLLNEERSWINTILSSARLESKSFILGDVLVIRDRDFYMRCQTLGDVVERRFPSEVFGLSSEQAGIVIDSVLKAAGHQTGKSKVEQEDGTDVCVVYSKKLADDLQWLALHAGYSANIVVTTVKRPQYAKRYALRFLRKRSYPVINNPRGSKKNTEVIDSNAPVFGLTIPNHTLYVRVNGKPVWSGNSGRYGNKGVVSEIVSDDQMIKDEAGRPVDVLLTSAGVVSRINPAQIIETAVGKVVEKTGKPLVVESFSGRDNVQWAKDLLKEHDLKDKETVFDPRSGKNIPNVMVGRQYIFKMFKSTDTNYSARGVDTYDANLQPTKGGAESAKSIGKMEFDALVAHNARNVLRESSVLKSQKNDEHWRALQLGYPTPPPRTSFASDKFFNMLTGAGVRVDRKGSKIGLAPLTDSDVMEMSAGEVQDAKLVSSKNLMPEKGGLFDPAVTGGMKGTKWSHINLAEPIVNPMFREPVRRLLGMTEAQLGSTIKTKGINFVKDELSRIDVTKRESELMDAANSRKGNFLDDATKQIKYLRALKAQNMSPEKAYISSVIPILPPVFRPVLPGKGGQELIYGDINPLYRDLIYVNNQFKELKKSGKLPDEESKLRGTLQDAVGAVYGMNDPITTKSKGRNHKGFLTYIAGQGSPKYGYAHSKLLSKKQDLAGRGTIVPDTTLGMDEVGLPENMIWTMYKPFMVKRLVGQGYPALQAKQMVDDKHPAAREAMLRETRERPVMINRAPTLHRYSVIGAYAIPTTGKTIRINPFAEVGSNSDYDGDCADCDLNFYSLTTTGLKCARLHIGDFPRKEDTRKVVGNKEIFEVPAGSFVFGFSAKEQRVQLCDVSHFSIHHDLEMVEVETESGRTVKVSRDHSMFGMNLETGKLERFKAEDGIGWGTPKPRKLYTDEAFGYLKMCQDAPDMPRVPVDENLGWVIGAWAGDGWVTKETNGSRGFFYIGLAKGEKLFRDEFVRRMHMYKKEFSVKEHEAPHDFGGGMYTSTKLHINDAELARWFADVIEEVQGAAQKQLPAWFMRAPREFLIGALAGLLDSDGSLSIVKAKAKPRPQIMAAYHTLSRSLAVDVSSLLLLLGIKSTIHPYMKKDRDTQYYQVYMSTPDLQKIAHELPCVMPEKLEVLRQLSATIFDMGSPENTKNDIVPISAQVVKKILPLFPQFKHMTGEGITEEQTEKRKQSRCICATLRNVIKSQRISRFSLNRIRDIVGADFLINEGGIDWYTNAFNEDLIWDFIKTVTPIPGRHTAWDLTVPDGCTFMTTEQLVVYDTMMVHVPAGAGAVEDVKRMTLSNTLYTDKIRGDMLVVPRMESVMGLAQATSVTGKGAAKKYNTRAEAMADYNSGKIGLGTKVTIKDQMK